MNASVVWDLRAKETCDLELIRKDDILSSFLFCFSVEN